MSERLRVLIVDNHRIFGSVLKLWLDRDPSLEVVGIALTGAEAIDLAVARDVQVVLMDVSLPDIDGFEATRRLRAVHHTARVIAVSAWPYEDIRSKVAASGMVGYLSKDRVHEHVRQAITAAVGG